MVKFIPVDPDDVDNRGATHRGRVSYPLLKSFLETGLVLAKIDMTGMQQKKQSLYSSLSSYIRNHDLPLKLFQRGGELHLMRLDTDEEGQPILDAGAAMAGEYKQLQEEEASVSHEEAKAITPEEVKDRFIEAQDPTR